MQKTLLEKLFAKTTFDPAIQRQFEVSVGWRYGLVFGILLVLFGWGWDAVELARVAREFFWLKILIVSSVIIPLTTLAGTLAGRIPQSLARKTLAWVVLGGVTGGMGLYLSFEGASAVVALFDPAVRGIAIFPFSPGVQERVWLNSAFGAIAGLFAAALQHWATNWAWDNSSTDNRFTPRNWLVVLGCLPITLALGALCDGAANAQLRGPLQTTDRIIRLALSAPPDLDTRQMPTAELLDYASAAQWQGKFSAQYTQRIADFNLKTLNEAYVDVEFDNGLLWRCSTAWSGSVLRSCRDLGSLYRDWMKQFWELGFVRCEDCSVRIDRATVERYNQNARTLGEPRQIVATHRAGGVVLMRTEFPSGTIECRLVGAEPVVIRDCVKK